MYFHTKLDNIALRRIRMIVWNGMDIIAIIIGGVAVLFLIGLFVIENIQKKSNERKKKKQEEEK